MTDRTIRKTDELWKSQQERVQVLEDQIHELMEMNDQLEAEVFSLRKMGASEEGANIILLCSVLFCGCVLCVVCVRRRSVRSVASTSERLERRTSHSQVECSSSQCRTQSISSQVPTSQTLRGFASLIPSFLSIRVFLL